VRAPGVASPRACRLGRCAASDADAASPRAPQSARLCVAASLYLRRLRVRVACAADAACAPASRRVPQWLARRRTRRRRATSAA
jgi:hypothetical protein